MEEDKKRDVVNIFVNEIEERNKTLLKQEKIFLQIHNNLFNNALYTNNNHKGSVIILTHIINNLILNFIKEVTNYINKVGVYKNE